MTADRVVEVGQEDPHRLDGDEVDGVQLAADRREGQPQHVHEPDHVAGRLDQALDAGREDHVPVLVGHPRGVRVRGHQRTQVVEEHLLEPLGQRQVERHLHDPLEVGLGQRRPLEHEQVDDVRQVGDGRDEPADLGGPRRLDAVEVVDDDDVPRALAPQHLCGRGPRRRWVLSRLDPRGEHGDERLEVAAGDVVAGGVPPRVELRDDGVRDVLQQPTDEVDDGRPPRPSRPVEADDEPVERYHRGDRVGDQPREPDVSETVVGGILERQVG